MTLALPIDHGYLAGLSVSVLWTFTTLFFTAASKRIGPAMVNMVRLLVALVLHTLTHRALNGHWLPDATWRHMFYLGSSGLIGLTIGDLCIFQAFLTIGPRRTLLIQTTAPLMATIFGWAALGETLGAQAWLGIALTLAGIAWVIRERSANGQLARSNAGDRRGYLLALVAALCQAAGLLLSKKGMGHGWLPAEQHLSPQTATLLRMTFATLCMAPLLLHRFFSERSRAEFVMRDPHHPSRRLGVLFSSCGAVTGPFLGVWLSLIAASRIPIGIAQTLLSLSPIMILPLAKWFYHERISERAIVGTILAVLGIAVLFVRA